MADGEEIPFVIHRDTRLPHIYALRYVLLTSRLPGASGSTSRNVCQGLAVGLSFLEGRNIDLVQRLSSGRFCLATNSRLSRTGV